MSNKKYAHIGSVETRTIEECSELIFHLAKAERFGWSAYHPETKKRNVTSVLEEIADVRKMLDELEAIIKAEDRGSCF